MSFKTDLHIHSWWSDGGLSPSEIVERYAAEKYDIISITDHEVTDGIREAMEAGKDKNIRVVPGIELATSYNGIELHILGYYFDSDNSRLVAKLEELAATRKNRNEKMLAVLQGMGINIEKKDLIKREGQTYIGKPDFASALLKKGYINNIAEAFENGRFLESDEVRSIKRPKPDTEEILEIIREAGGLPVLAHPYRIKEIGKRESEEFKSKFDILLRELRSMGLKGLECIYPKYSDDERLFFIDEAARYHMHITEGTDFHR